MFSYLLDTTLAFPSTSSTALVLGNARKQNACRCIRTRPDNNPFANPGRPFVTRFLASTLLGPFLFHASSSALGIGFAIASRSTLLRLRRRGGPPARLRFGPLRYS
jgi:hypothetical protein